MPENQQQQQQQQYDSQHQQQQRQLLATYDNMYTNQVNYDYRSHRTLSPMFAFQKTDAHVNEALRAKVSQLREIKGTVRAASVARSFSDPALYSFFSPLPFSLARCFFFRAVERALEKVSLSFLAHLKLSNNMFLHQASTYNRKNSAYFQMKLST